MKRLHRVAHNSKTPTLERMTHIAENLSRSLNRTCFVEAEAVKYSHLEDPISRLKISFVPGFNEECTAYKFNTWPELLEMYSSLMKEAPHG